MVAIDGDQVGRDAGDGDGDGTVAATARSREPHSYPEVPDSLQRTARHLLNQLRVVLAITVRGRERHGELVPDATAGQLTLKTGHEIAVAVQIRQRLARRGTVDDLPCLVPQRVMDADDLVLADAHVGRGRTTPLTAPRTQARPGGCALMGREGYHSALPLARTQAGGRGANLKGTTMRVVYSGVLAAVFSMSAAVAGDGAAPTTAGTSAMNDNALKADNPFARPSTLPYELPPFDRIHDGDYLPAFHAGMREQLKEVERIAHNREPPTFENTLIALERAGQLLRRVDATFGPLNACNTNPKLQDIDTEMAPKLTAQEDAIHLNPALWTRVEALYDKRARPHLDPESQQLLTRYHTACVRAGARLEPADQTRLRALNTAISTLPTRFKHNVLKATADGAVVVDEVRDLDGLSEGQIGAAAQAAAARGLGGKWVIALQNTTNQPLLAQLKNRALRQRIYEASIGRARGGSSDNTAVI